MIGLAHTYFILVSVGQQQHGDDHDSQQAAAWEILPTTHTRARQKQADDPRGTALPMLSLGSLPTSLAGCSSKARAASAKKKKKKEQQTRQDKKSKISCACCRCRQRRLPPAVGLWSFPSPARNGEKKNFRYGPSLCVSKPPRTRQSVEDRLSLLETSRGNPGLETEDTSAG
jgi:hypothetical protein